MKDEPKEQQERDRQSLKAEMAATDRKAELAMLMDFNGIRRDKSDPAFEERVAKRKSQCIGETGTKR